MCIIASLRSKLSLCQGYTPLHLACDRGNLAVVEVLLKHGADRNLKASRSFIYHSRVCAHRHPMQDPDELTALELAETCGHEDIANLLKDGQ